MEIQLSSQESNFISLGSICDIFTQKTFADLINLSEILPNMSHLQRKQSLLKHLMSWRDLFSRLLVIIRWSKHAPDAILSINIHDYINKMDACFSDSSDSLYVLHQELKNYRDPIFDLASAINVLTTGKFNRLVLSRFTKDNVVDDDRILKLNDLISVRVFCQLVVPIEMRRNLTIGLLN